MSNKMKIGIIFYGMLYGSANTDNRPYDIRHCWPNLYKNIVKPFESDCDVDILLSTYKMSDVVLEKEIYDLIKPKNVVLSNFDNSNSKTTKFASFDLLKDVNYDFVILTRTDLHFKNPMRELFDYQKFNFLFREKGHHLKTLTCDNFYAWPNSITNQVRECFLNCPKLNSHDTHRLLESLSATNIPLHYMDGVEEHYSDINKYFSICKSSVDTSRVSLIHPEVAERFNIKTL